LVELFGRVIWWNQASSPARLPARPWPPNPARRTAPSAAATPRRTVELHSPPTRFLVAGQRCNNSSYRRYGPLIPKLQMIPPQRKLPTSKANAQGTYFAVANKWHHISPLRRCLGQPRRHLR
jgi:hypothetical protein